MKQFIFPMLIASLLSACASTTPSTPQYVHTPHLDDSSNSHALVLTHAVGIRGLTDADNISVAKSNGTGSTAVDNSLTLMSTGGESMEMDTAFIVGSAIALVTTDDSAKDDKLFAWLPTSVANSPELAQKKFSILISSAFQTASRELGLSVKYDSEPEINTFGAIASRAYLESRSIGCESTLCSVKTRVTVPTSELVKAPAFTSLDEGFLFTARHTTSKIDIDIPDSYYEHKQELLQRISSLLPDWAFIYIAPHIYNFDGKVLNTRPFVLNRGKILTFTKPAI